MKNRSSNNDDLIPYQAGEHCDAAVRQYLTASLASNTLLAYRSDLKHFSAWGGVIPTTPEQIANYVAYYASRLAESTLSRRLVAIAHAHTVQGLASPTNTALVRATLKGVRRARVQTIRQVAALQKQQLIQMVKGLTGMAGLRDTALLMIGFSGAMRRSELVALDIEDIRLSEDGARIRLRRSKTDQEGRGRVIAIPRMRGRYCPCRVLEVWLKSAKITTGALFRQVNRFGQVLPLRLSAQSVALIIKQRAEGAGLDSTRYSGHSLRAGFATNAARQGASTSSIREQTGHKSDAMLNRYIRNAELFRDNPLSKIW